MANDKQCDLCRQWVMLDGQTQVMLPHSGPCPTCGEKMHCGGIPHRTVERVVRPHQIFSNKQAGQLVLVEERLLGHASVLKATMSVEEHAAVEAAKTSLKPDHSEGPKEVERLTKQAREEWVRQKKQHEHSAKRAADKANVEAKAG